MRAVYLFDLDGTLMDTTGIASIRQKRQWKECVRRFRETSLYPGIAELLAAIRSRGEKVGVVTTSVSYYAENALRYHGISYDALVAYHDVRATKPAPDCYQLAMTRLGGSPSDSVGIGDDAVDARSLRAAGITSVAAAWNPHHHADAEWDVVAWHPSEVLAL